MLSSLLANLPDVSELTGQASKVINLILDFIKLDPATSSLVDETMDKISSTYSLAISVIILAFAILGCFCGYRLARLFMALTGFIAGIVAGALFAVNFLDATNGMILLCGLVGGILVSLFSYSIYKAGIFILCFFFAFVAAANLLPLTGDIAFFGCTIIGFIVGTVALKFVRPVIIFTSAGVCSYSAAKSIMVIGPLTHIDFLQQANSMYIIFAALFVLGILVQFLTSKAPEKKVKKLKNKNRE